MYYKPLREKKKEREKMGFYFGPSRSDYMSCQPYLGVTLPVPREAALPCYLRVRTARGEGCSSAL